MEIARRDHCAFCFDTIYHHFDPSHPHTVVLPSTSCPLFVTWTVIKPGSSVSSKGKLRGCIGTFTPVILPEGLERYALTSALEDRRFSPITLPELQNIKVSVSLLGDFEQMAHPRDFEIGKHGLWMEFHVRGKRYSATYLPEVIHEQGWSKTEALESLVRKSGYLHRPSESLYRTCKFTRYRSTKSSLTHHEYISFRNATSSSTK